MGEAKLFKNTCPLQELMALLEGSSPRVALHCLRILQNLFLLPGDLGGPGSGTCLVDKNMCVILQRTPGVMNPLLRFAIANCSDNPASDLEMVAAFAYSVLRAMHDTLRSTDYNLGTAWENGRYAGTSH